MDRVSCLCHVEAGGLDASGGIRPRKVELGDAVISDETAELITCESIAFGLCKDVLRYYVQFGYELRPRVPSLKDPVADRFKCRM